MPVTYEYDTHLNQVTTKVLDVLHSYEIIDYFNDLINNQEIKSNFIEIVDFNNAEDLILKFTDLAKLKRISELLIRKGHKVTLFCAYDELSQGMSNMMMPLFQSVKLNVIVCKNKQGLENSIRIINK